jgi:hypothetical protein
MLSLPNLRAELTVIFLSYKVRTELLDSFTNWKNFVGVLLHDLCNRPLRLPTNPSGKTKAATNAAIARMKAKWPGPHIGWSRALYVTLERSKEAASDVFFWSLEVEAPFLKGAANGALTFKSELLMTETAANFKNP